MDYPEHIANVGKLTVNRLNGLFFLRSSRYIHDHSNDVTLTKVEAKILASILLAFADHMPEYIDGSSQNRIG